MADFFKNLKEQAEDWETNSERGNIWGWKFSLFGAVWRTQTCVPFTQRNKP